jgi:hypothetical protein
MNLGDLYLVEKPLGSQGSIVGRAVPIVAGGAEEKRAAGAGGWGRSKGLVVVESNIYEVEHEL